MPERVHRRFDEIGSEDASQSNVKKRKRESIDQQQDLVGIQNGSREEKLPARREPKDSKPKNFSQEPLPKRNANTNETNPQATTTSSLKKRAQALWQARKSLPIWAHAAQIRDGLRAKDVMLLVGETGSGKSTQVPQILIDEEWCKPHVATPSHVSKKQNSLLTSLQRNGTALSKITVGGCIAITEPRRVAAITLARRVAEEMGTPLGSSSPASKVGYSVRFDNSTSPSTRIKFLTEGMLLQEMLRDPWLKAYSAVIVDEVHERGVNVDLLLGFMRQMVAGQCEGRGGVPLKVVVMSATAEMERLGKFFEEGYGMRESIPNGKAVCNGDQMDGKAESEWSGFSSSDEEIEVPVEVNGHSSVKTVRQDQESNEKTILNGGRAPVLGNEVEETGPSLPHVATCFIEGRQYPVTVKYTPEPVQNIVEAALHTIFQIHHKEPMPGDILVFLTGQETVESLESLVTEYAQGLRRDVPKMLILPLFAALSQAAQQRVFQPAPARTRKVIIATNIAETSVTVSGVRFVIDCGKAKIKQFRSSIGLDSLLAKPISKSAAIQRTGRAGREAPGQCYRLYTEADYLTMQQSNTPEILRCDLSHAILTMKARGVDDVVNFPFLNHPPLEALQKALLQLYNLGALTDSGDISDIGQRMAKLPLNVSLGRVLIAAAEPEMNCVAEVIDIISCLSVENIFLNLTSEEKKEEAELARRELFRREGDHLTLLTTVQAYAAEHSDRKSWADRHFISHRAMKAVMDVRKQLRQQQCHSVLEASKGDQTSSMLSSELAISILKCFLKGFATNTARLFPDGGYKTISGYQNVAIHPSSVLFGKKVEAIMYNEFVFTNKSYARGVSAIQMDWIAEAMGV